MMSHPHAAIKRDDGIQKEEFVLFDDGKFKVEGDKKPEPKLLNRHVIPQHASHWEEIGLELGLKDYTIENISKDNTGIKERFKAVLRKWLEGNDGCTWGKLDDAIKMATKGEIGIWLKVTTDHKFLLELLKILIGEVITIYQKKEGLISNFVAMMQCLQQKFMQTSEEKDSEATLQLILPDKLQSTNTDSKTTAVEPKSDTTATLYDAIMPGEFSEIACSLPSLYQAYSENKLPTELYRLLWNMGLQPVIPFFSAVGACIGTYFCPFYGTFVGKIIGRIIGANIKTMASDCIMKLTTKAIKICT